MFFVYRLNSDFKSFVYYCLLHDYSVYPFTVVLYASLISLWLTNCESQKQAAIRYFYGL